MRKFGFAFLFPLICATSLAQTTPADRDILDRLRALYDTPFRRGLINFDCAVGFDFEKHLKESFGAIPPAAAAIAVALRPIQYRVFVDRDGAVVSSETKFDVSSVPHAAEIEESNRDLLRAGLNSWGPYAAGTLFPLGPTQYHFEENPGNPQYKLAMSGQDLEAVLSFDANFHLLSGIIEKPQHIETTTDFISGPNGLLLSTASTNTNHAGTARFHFTYQTVSGFQIPASVDITSEQKLTWSFTMTDCKVQSGQTVRVGPPHPTP